MPRLKRGAGSPSTAVSPNVPKAGGRWSHKSRKILYPAGQGDLSQWDAQSPPAHSTEGLALESRMSFSLRNVPPGTRPLCTWDLELHQTADVDHVTYEEGLRPETMRLRSVVQVLCAHLMDPRWNLDTKTWGTPVGHSLCVVSHLQVHWEGTAGNSCPVPRGSA